MIENRQKDQQSFFGNYVYDKVVKKDHFLKKVEQTIDFTFVNVICSDLYELNNGRPGWSPMLMVKVLLLQFMYDLSDYAVEEELQDRLSFKMFVGLEVEETPPDHSSISRFRSRLGTERFKELFNRVVTLAREKGLVSDKLHIVDSTQVQAKVDLFRLKKEHKKDNPTDFIDRHSPDKDARTGTKSGGKKFFGYQAHVIMDAESEVIVNVATQPGDVRDHTQLKPLASSQPAPRAMTADKAYDCQENHRFLSENKIDNGIILKKNHTTDYLKKHIKRRSETVKRYRSRIEHKMAHLKQYHGLAKARYLGLARVGIQTFMAAICSNVKRIVQVLYRITQKARITLKAAPSY